MKSLVFSLSALAVMALVHAIPCYDSTRCGGYNYMGASSYGHVSANIENGAGGGGYEVGEESNGGGEYNGGGGSAAYGGGGGVGSDAAGGSGYQGGGGSGQQGGDGYRHRNRYCPNCYVQNFGNGNHSANTIYINNRRN